jgi:hypothetical protein
MLTWLAIHTDGGPHQQVMLSSTTINILLAMLLDSETYSPNTYSPT